MHDQADYLRRLVHERNRAPEQGPGDAPRMITVLGGKGGVGATTLAVNLSVALVQSGQRVVLVDADLDGPNVSGLCQLDDGDSLLEILDGRRTVHEVLERGPAGVLVVPGKWAPGVLPECPVGAQRRLIEQLNALGPHADLVILDVGSGLSPRIRRFVEASQQVLVVSTTDSMAVMDSYAAIKVLIPAEPQSVATVLNRVSCPLEADEVQRRLTQCCQRFLGRTVEHLGSIPFDPEVQRSGATGRPHMLSAPDSPASQSVQQLAQRLAGVRAGMEFVAVV